MMITKTLKLVLSLFLLTLSPLVVVAIASAMIIAIQLANGKSLSAGILIIREIFQNLYPFLPYITGIPAVLVVLAIATKNHRKIQNWFANLKK